MRVLSLSAALLTLGVSILSAQAANTGTGGGATDPNWTASWTELLGGSSSGSLPNAYIPLSIPSAPWQPNTGLFGGPNWISAWSDASATGYRTGDNASNYAYTFTTDVTASGLYTLSLGWDNKLVGIFQNDVLLFGPSDLSGFCRDGDGVFPSSAFPNCTENINLNLSAAYPLVFKLLGDGTTDGLFVGFDAVDVPKDVTPEPGTMTLLATGLVGLVGAGFRRRRVIAT